MWRGIKNTYHLLIAIFANFYSGFPAKKLKIIGVTGTDGKTTTVNLIYHILKKAGFNVSMISTVGAVINGKNYNLGFHVTTPSSFAIQDFLKKIVSFNRDKPQETNYLVLEVTSHALDQHRIFGIHFEIGVITNITHEHLDYHKTYQEYVKTKMKLLKKAKTAIVNQDDQSYKIILNLKAKTTDKKWVTYGLTKTANVNPYKFPFQMPIDGEFNKYNILAAIAVCSELGIREKTIKEALESFKLPLGRTELVYNGDFKIMIDFAHTPNALQQILSSLKVKMKGRMIHVFGSAGERDYKKRPLMGAISAKFADVIILTSEDPRSESAEKIINEIKSGIKKKSVFEIIDRQEAITKAVKMARSGDLVIITGKGHEKSINMGKEEKDWSEHKAVEKALQFK